MRFPGSGGLRPARGLVDVAHAHAFRDEVAQALVGGGGGWGHGGILALRGSAPPALVMVDLLTGSALRLTLCLLRASG
jgi:hypothetical protein